MGQLGHGDVQQADLMAGKTVCQTVLVLDVHMEVGENAGHRLAGELLQHIETWL